MTNLTPEAQAGALCTLSYLSDLITVGRTEQYSRTDLLIVLDCIKNDPDLFDPEVVRSFDATEVEN